MHAKFLIPDFLASLSPLMQPPIQNRKSRVLASMQPHLRSSAPGCSPAVKRRHEAWSVLDSCDVATRRSLGEGWEGTASLAEEIETLDTRLRKLKAMKEEKDANPHGEGEESWEEHGEDEAPWHEADEAEPQ